MFRAQSHVCVAALGRKPQVIVPALDALLERGYPVAEVIALHHTPDNDRYRAAMDTLARAFDGGTYQGRTVRYRAQAVPCTNDAEPDAAAEADVAIGVLNALLLDLKRLSCVVHLCLVGDQALLGLLSFSAALLYLDHTDRIWHLPSHDGPRSADGNAPLVRVPVLPWGQYFPALRLAAALDYPPRQAQAEEFDDAERSRCAQVYAFLTARQREVLRLLATDHIPQEIASILRITLATVNDHKTVICRNCLNAWELPETKRLDYNWLRRKFAPFVATL